VVGGITILKRIIYIGEVAGDAIYFDTKQKQPLKAKKSKLLSNQKSKNSSRYIIYILLTLFMLGSIFNLLGNINDFYGVYTVGTLLRLCTIWFLEFVCLTFFTHRILYRNLKDAELASKHELGQAIRSNNIWNIFSDKKVTISKKIIAWIVTLAIAFASIGFIYVLYKINEDGYLLGHAIGNEIFALLFYGFLLFILYYIIWENNLIRWLDIVGKYQKRKLDK
jgi:hypothetical protein